MQYAGFWRRLGAILADGVFMCPLFAVIYVGLMQSHLFFLYWLLPSILFGLWYNVYLVKKFGATPGQRAFKLQIVMADGSPVTLKAAFVRYLVLFVLLVLYDTGSAIASFRIDGPVSRHMDFAERSELITMLTPAWASIVWNIGQVWLWGELLILLCNEERRALQDYMAGTVVIKTAATMKVAPEQYSPAADR